MEDSKLRKVYDTIVKEGYDVPDFATFETDMRDDKKLTLVRDRLVEDGYELPDFEQFKVDMFGTPASAPANPTFTAQQLGLKEEAPQKGDNAWDTYKDVGAVKPAVQSGEKETLTTFGEGVKQGADAIYQGNKYFVGEQARFWNGAQQDAKKALEFLDAQGEDFDAKGWDVRKAMDEVAQKQWEKDYAEFLKVKEARRKERKEGNMGMWERILHKAADPSMPEPLEARRINPTNMSYQRPLLTLNDALKEADGDVVKAREILENKASEEQWADKTMREASEAMAKHKPVEGAAWWGQMVPQVAGQATAIASNFVPYVGGFLGKALSYGTTAGLTASSAGQAMAEARRAGASDDEVWSAGVAQAVIEAGSEQIPLNRLIGKTGSAAFKKGYKAVADNIPEKELEKLLVEGNKRLGGKLLSGKTAKELVKDMGVEGASEFVAEFLGTYVPIIYADKESYPTLLEAVKNGWEGAKAGFAMGGFLGGGSTALSNTLHENRRKKQGFVELANDKDGNVVEVVGEKEGLVTVLTQDGATKDYTPEELSNIGTFSYDEWKNAKVDAESRNIENAFDKGFNEPGVDTGDKLFAAEQVAKTALGLNTEESIEDFIGERTIDEVAMGDEDLKNKLNAYFKAKAEDEGRRERFEMETQRRYAEVDKSIDNTANKDDGMVYSATLPGGETVFITDGTVVLDNEGYIDVNRSRDLIALFPDNSKKAIEAGDIREKIEVSNAQELKDARHAEIDSELSAPKNAFSVNAEDGAHTIEVVEDNGNGFFTIVDNGEQKIIDEAFLYEISGGQFGKPAEGVVSVASENTQPVTENATETATEAPVTDNVQIESKAVQTQVPDFFRLDGKNYSVVSLNGDGSVNVVVDGKRTVLPVGTDFSAVVPTDDKGNIQFTDMPAEKTLEYIAQRVPNGKARQQMIENNRKQAENALKKFDKEPNVGTDPDAYEATMNKWEADKKAAQEKVDYWNEVAKRDADINHSDIGEAYDNVQPKGVVEITPDEFIASNLPKITPESFKRETGLKNSELKNLVGVIAGAEKGGVTIEQAAESILENYGDELRGLGFTGDVQEVRNIIIDILSGGNPRSYAKRGLEQRKQQSIDEQRAEMEDVAVQLGFKDIEEWIAYEESFLPSKLEKYKDFDENEYFNNLAENNEDDTTRESENFGRGSEILQNEQSADNSGERTVDERNEGTTVSNNVQGGDTNGTPQSEQIQAAEAEVNTNPTDKQKEAGNYKKGHVQIGAFNVTIEQPKGSVRSGVDADGKKWEVEMQNTYGYIRGTEGVDGDHIDVFLSDDIDGWDGRKVFVVDQRNADGSFDEHKVMLGFNDINDAEAAYMSNYEEGWQGLGAITGVSIEEFEKWITSSHRKTKAFAEYKSVKTIEGQSASAERHNLADFKEGDVVRDYYDKKLYRIKKHSKNGVSIIAELDAEGNEVGTTTMNTHNNSRYSLAEAPVKADTPTISQEGEKVSDHVEQPTNPSGNRLVTDERYAELRERMRKKLGGQMNIGIDPEILAIGTEMAVYHLEKGARKFTEYAKVMVADLGDAIRPYLKAFYNGARNLPEVESSEIATDMTPYDEVQTFDVANFDKQGFDVFATAETVTREAEVAQEVEVAQERIKKVRKTKNDNKNSINSQQEQLNLFDNGREENTAADNSGTQLGRKELPDTEQVGAGVSVQDTARDSKRKRRNTGVRSSKLGNGPQYDVNRDYSNEEIEKIVSSVTDIVDGKVVITDEVTDDIKAIARGYESGGIAKKGRGILDEYYTDGKIVDAVNMLIAPYFSSSTPIRVLEPSIGIGNFIQAVNNIPTSEVVAFEINETTARIAKILYPDVDVNMRSFETEFIDESGNKKPLPQKYSLVIGNPPYGSHRGLYKGLGEESKISRYEDYFVKRSLDVLNEGGVLAMVLPSSWMDRHTKFGGYTIERAYRLPSGAFEATQVGTDIVILRKDSSVPVTEHVPYFEQFPERVLGEIKERTGRYGRTEEFVEGDIDAAIEAIKKENAEQLADLLDIEKSNDALNNIESAIDETGSTEKAVDVVKDAQNSEKADNKPATKLSGKQDKYKVELNRGAETVPTSSQFTHEFSEGEVEAFADTDYEGTLSNPTKHKRYANYIGGNAVHDFYYAEGDIYSKLALLEQDKRYIVENYGAEQYEKQKALLESVLPKQKSLDEITISPNTAFVKNLNILTDGERVSLKDMFVDFCRKLPYQAFGSSSAWEVIGYVNNEQVHGTDKQRNQLVRERRKRAANDLFNKFLNEELSDNAKKQVVAAFNREYNSTYRPDYSKVPMFSTINRDFKGKPLKLTSVQLAGIGRMTVKGVGVLAHEVGFGKTLSGILAMHEAMTRGFAKKPLIVVPNDNILKQWVETIGEVLSSATVNTLGNLGAGYDLTDFMVNDGEFTIITYEGLKAMSFSDGTYNHLASKFSYITEDLNKHQSERDIQRAIEKKNELKGKMKRGTKASYMFENFGFDWLTVDEVHNANHIVSKVRLDKSVASDFRSQSQRTSDLGLKTWLAAQYIQEENNGRNVLLLSATPFTNKPLEYYSVLSLVGNDMLERKGFFNVDQFFATFMEADNELEIGANGRPVQKTNVRRFRNNGLFQQLLSEFIDIKGEEDNPELVRPERLNKEYKIAQNELTTEAMAAAQELLSDNDTVLQGIGHARAAAFSPYATSLLGMQPKNHKEFVKNSPKIDATIKMIEQNIKDRPDAGQIIYSEVGVEYFPLIRDYLVKESGLKPSEVRIITGATSNNERVNIQSAFNNGEVKVVVGSPAIKEGLNLQGNTTDMYILSLPWNFTQLRQIEGRGWRQGNKWENIRINYMLTNDSVDVFMLQRLQLKQGLYNEAMKSGAESLDVSDIDTAELKTALITDPVVRAEIVTVQERAKLQQEKTQIEADLSFVMRKYEAYNKLVSKLESQKNTIKMYREWAKKGDEYWAQRVEREEAQLTSIENEIEEEKQNLIKKGVNVDDIVRQTQQSQNDIAAIQEKIDNLKEFQEELTQKFREESEAKAKEQGDLVSAYIKERKAENKGGFYKIRPVKSENKAVEEEDDTLYREDDKISYDEAVLIAEEFVRTHKGAAKKVVISKGYEFVEQQMRNAGFSEVSIEAFKKNNAKGKRTTAAYYPDSDGIVIFKTGDKSSFMDSIWHENSHRVLDKYIKNPRLLKIRFDELPVKYKDIIIKLLEGNYEEYQYPEEAMCMFIGGLYKNTPYLKNGKYNITRDFITFEKEYRRFVDFAQNVIDNIYYGRETEFDGDGPSGINGKQGEWNSTHQRNSGRERDGGTNKERAEVVNREGEGSITDREVVMDSDPYSKALGRPRYTGRKMGEYVARQRMEMAKRVKALAQKLNLNIDVLESTEGLSGKRAKAKGWYEPKGKRIVVVIPNHSSVNDAVATVLHEAVAHHGLRELFGENFDTFLQNVYNNADADMREAIETLAAQRYNGNLLTATEEYLASLAENTDFEYATKSGWWERIKDYFFKMLRGLGIEGFSGITLTDNELRYILWRSYQNLATPGMYNNVFGRVKDTAKQYELKVGDYAPAVQNGSMVAGEDIDNSYTELSYEEAQGTATADDTRFRIEENSIDNVPTQPLTFTEKITNSVLEASARNKENLTQRSEALRAYGSNLANVLKLMQAQRVYDKSTVDTLMKMAKMYFKNAQLLGHITPYEAGRIMSVLHGAVGKRDVTNDANKLVGILVDAHSKELQGLLDKAAKTKAKKVNASGVEVMGSLDKMGQIALEAYNEAVDLDEKAIEDKLYEAQNDTAHPEEAEARINGLMMAREYVTDIKQKKQEIKDLQALLKEKAKDAREGNMSRRAWKEFRKDTEEAIMEDKLGVIDAYHSLIYRMSTDISKASARAKAFQKSVIDHTREIQHFANSDMQGRSASAQGELPTKYNNAVLRGLMSGAPTFQYMLKKFGEKDVDGKGYLYDYFMGAVTKAKDKEFNGKLGNTLLMEAKLEELFGKKMKIADLYKYMRADGTTLTYREGGEMREMEISQGQMLYIYMLNKMADGRMKLSGMGITGDVVAKMAEELPKELVAFADWVQDDFLTKLREKYNIVHERMFGAPMAAIENYFPIKVNKRSIGSKEDISKDIENDKLSTMTGAIIKRKKNAAPIDLSVDALSALLDHINEMEHWAAFAEFNRDVNTLVNYNHFKNQVMNMSSFRYGSGKTLWENFRKTAQVVSGTYRPEQNTIDKAVLNISKGVTASKIAFRGYTAVKQVLSAPAFWSEASVDNLLFCYVNPKGSCEWAMEFLPGFKERWMGRMMGNEKLLPQDSDWKIWRNNFVKNATRIGMTPNAAVDALTVAQGARAVYLTKLEAYKKAGYTEQRANEKALQAAAEVYNESQQSSMGAYISPIQASGTAMTSLLTTFKNANFGYTRKTAQSLANIKRHTEKGYKEEAIAYMTKKFMREGLTEEQAKKLAERRYKRSVYGDSANVALYGLGLNMLWMLGGSAIYLLAGDDDEKKEELVNEALIRGALGSLDGIPLGETLANWATASMMGEDAQLRMPRLIAVNDFENIVQIMKSDRVRGAYELANMFIAMGIGVNPTTFVDAFMAFADVEEWSAEEVAMLALKILNAPKSQLELLTVDKAMANGGVDATEVMRRYVEQRTRNQAPGLQGLYSDENLQKAWTKNAKRFDRFLDERLENVIEDDFAFRMFYDDADAMTRAKISEMREKYLKGDDKAFVKKELEDVINGVYFGAEKKTVYYGLANEDDLNEDFELKQMIALLSPVYSEYLKMKDGLQKGNFFNEHKDEIVLYKNLNARKSKMDSMKKYMQDNPGLAEKNMREIRKLRTEAMNLISGYNE